MSKTILDFVLGTKVTAAIARITGTTTSTTQPSVNSADVNHGFARYAVASGTSSIVPYYMFGDTCWRGPLGDVRLSAANEFNIEDNGAYTDDPTAPLIMAKCLMQAYKMAVELPPEDRPK